MSETDTEIRTTGYHRVIGCDWLTSNRVYHFSLESTPSNIDLVESEKSKRDRKSREMNLKLQKARKSGRSNLFT
jgi:hypothetical protein